MKSLIYIIALSIFSLNAVNANQEYSEGQYCAELKDGMVVVFYKAIEIETEISLSNGTIIRKNGTVTKEDGSKFNLVAGECLDAAGNKITNDKP